MFRKRLNAKHKITDYLSVKISREQCQKAAIFLSFEETNDGKNLTT